MFKGKKFKFFLTAMVILLMIANSSISLSLIAASGLSSDFRQLNYVQLLSEMGTGWNLGNTLEANINGTPGETAWGNPTVTKQFITKVKSAGFKSIRIPVSYLSKIGAAPDYTIDAAWLDRIQEIVDYACSQDMYVIINMHGDGYKTVTGSWLLCYSDGQTAIKAKYKKVWQQIADRFVNYNEHLIFESMNEEFDGDWDDPNPVHYANLNAYNQIFVDTVRQTGGNNSARWLLIPGWNTDIYYTTADFGFVIPTDNYRSSAVPSNEKRIAISVHYYSPWDFCGDTSSPVTQWGEGAANPDKTSTWGQEDYMESQFNAMYNKFVTQGYPFIVGEYGTIDKTSSDPKNNTYRAAFAKALCKTVKKYGGVPVYWDNGFNGDSGMAVFDRGTGAITQKGVVDAIMNALSTTPAFDPGVTPVLVTPTPLPDGSFTVTYDVGGSGTINVTIKNNLTTRNINGWTMEFTFPGDQKITNMWGGSYTQNGSHVTIKNADYTSKIPANGGIVTFGFNVSYSGTNDKPSIVVINGSASTIEGGVPTHTPVPSSSPAGYKISGYIAPDFSVSSGSNLMSGFTVEIEGKSYSAITGQTGYYELSNIPLNPSGYTIKISKPNYLYREIKNVSVTGNIQLGSSGSPLLMWAGDIRTGGIQDNAINMSDIMEIARGFNSAVGDGRYNADYDVNKDNAVNMTDIMTVTKHFNTVPSSYPAL